MQWCSLACYSIDMAFQPVGKSQVPHYTCTIYFDKFVSAIHSPMSQLEHADVCLLAILHSENSLDKKGAMIAVLMLIY